MRFAEIEVLVEPLKVWSAVLPVYTPEAVLYSNQMVVETPLGFTVPLKVLELALIFVLEPVAAPGTETVPVAILRYKTLIQEQ